MSESINENENYVHCKDCYYYFNNFLCLKFSKLGSMAGVKGLTVENRIVAIVGSEFGCAEGILKENSTSTIK